MTTNAQIAAMFNAIKATLEEMIDALKGQNFRKISTTDAYGNPIEFEPDLVFLMIGLKKPVPNKPNTYTPVTRLFLNRIGANGGPITFDLDGLPADVRRQIGGPVPDDMSMEAPAEISRVTHTDLPVTDTDTVITSKGSTVTEANGAVWTIAANNGNKTLRNGEWFGGGQGVEYAIVNGVVYVLGTDNNGTWYRATATEWISVGALPTA